MSLNIVFMGTPEFAKYFLEHIYINKKFNISAVYTQASKKSHRGQKVNTSSVYKFAKEKKLNIFCPSKFLSSDINNIKKINPDVIIVVAYGLILPKEELELEPGEAVERSKHCSCPSNSPLLVPFALIHASASGCC